jgi:molybdate transport system ATP-binding protein
VSITVKITKKLSRAFTLTLDFETGKDSCLGILGPSGSGKSMTLKCIAGIETPDEGFIAVDGRVLFDSSKKINLSPQERRVGYLFQNYALFPRMTVLENIAAPMAARGLAAEDCRREAALWISRFGLTGMENHYPRQLSGGQQQRTALARMLVCKPSAALFDEPFSALDSTLREYMQLQLQELLRDKGDGDAISFRNAILVTHNRDEVYRLCPELAVMASGAMLIKDTSDKVFQNPRFVNVARLTGCKNISPVRLLGDKELFALDWGLRLRTAKPVDGVTHIGIRAHDLIPVDENSAPGFNEARVAVSKRSSEPFEEVVLFTNADAEDLPGQHQKEIWWKYSKYLKQQIPKRLFFPPESLLLLKE